MKHIHLEHLLIMVMVGAFLLAGAQFQTLGTEIGETEVYLVGDRELVRTGETNLGNLITDVLRERTDADVAIYNGGGIRDSADLGSIVLEDAMNILAFENDVVKLELSGSQLIETLEHGVSHYPEVAGGFLQVSGMRYYFNPEKPAGERIEKVYVGGEEIDPDASYTLTTNGFLAAGGDEYETLEQAEKIETYEPTDTKMFVDYIQENSPLFPKVEGRIVVTS